jgi:hypothetical protein
LRSQNELKIGFEKYVAGIKSGYKWLWIVSNIERFNINSTESSGSATRELISYKLYKLQLPYA